MDEPHRTPFDMHTSLKNKTIAVIHLVAGGVTLALMASGCSQAAAKDPRLQSPRVEMFKAAAAGSNTRTFTGIVEARVQSDVGFRVGGKILERPVEVGERCQKGEVLRLLGD